MSYKLKSAGRVVQNCTALPAIPNPESRRQGLSVGYAREPRFNFEL